MNTCCSLLSATGPSGATPSKGGMWASPVGAGGGGTKLLEVESCPVVELPVLPLPTTPGLLLLMLFSEDKFVVGSLVGTDGWTTCWSTACCAIARNDRDSAPVLLDGPLTKGKEDEVAELEGGVAVGGRGDGAVLIDDATVPVESTDADELNLDGAMPGTVVCCCCCCCGWDGAELCVVDVNAGDCCCCCDIGDDSAWLELLLEFPSDDWLFSSFVTAL